MIENLDDGWYWVRETYWSDGAKWEPVWFIKRRALFWHNKQELEPKYVAEVGPRIAMPDDSLVNAADADLIAALERKPYDRASREAAQRLRELLGAFCKS